MLAFTSEPMVRVERQTGVVLRPIALPRNLIAFRGAPRRGTAKWQSSPQRPHPRTDYVLPPERTAKCS